MRGCRGLAVARSLGERQVTRGHWAWFGYPSAADGDRLRVLVRHRLVPVGVNA